MLPKESMEILACPACRGGLTPDPVGNALLCLSCRLRYPVREGIPVLLADQAEPMEKVQGPKAKDPERR